jgi:hypothetical protein
MENNETQVVQETSKFKFPSEHVELPSKGLLYPKSSPLHSGTIEMKYMTAKEEDILTNQNYISKGIVVDKLLQSLILTKCDYDELLVGDKNAIMVAARVLGYGSDYSFTYEGNEYNVELGELDNIELREDLIDEPGVNSFKFTLPKSKNEITFKLLNGKDEKIIEGEIKGIQKINKTASPETTTRLKHMILSINGDDDRKTIRDFVDNYMLAADSRALREYIKSIQPDINMTFTHTTEDGVEEDVRIPINLNFFWPDFGL